MARARRTPKRGNAARKNVAVVLAGIDPPRDPGRMSLVVRHIADLLGDQIAKGSISTKTSSPADRLPERAEAARTMLMRQRRGTRMRRIVPIDPREPAAIELFVQWAPWSDDARLQGKRRRDVRVSLASSGRSFWANLDPDDVEALDGWLRSRAIGHLVDIDKWAKDQKRAR